MSQSPLILVTNDDGIHSPWLAVLARQLAPLGQVIVSAPATEQSAVGHGLTLGSILRYREQQPGWYAVAGTPADAVMLAIFEFCPRKPDLVVSGINPGPNLGADVFYSGTVAGALEGAMKGTQALAVSQDLPAEDGEPLEQLMQHTASFAADVARQVLARPLRRGVALSINAPATVARGFAITRMGKRIYRENIERRQDPRGGTYYWIGGSPMRNISPPGTDAHAVEQGLFSITPLGLDLTTTLGDWSDQFHPGSGWEDLSADAGGRDGNGEQPR